MVHVFTDGSAVAKKGHPYYRHGGMAAVFVINGRVEHIVSKGYRNTSTGRMELRGVLTALQSLDKNQPAIIYSDSQYAVKTFTEGWINGWFANGWPCKNPDLMQLLYAEHYRFTPGIVRFRHVKGHSGHTYNEIADRFASYKNFTEFEADLPTGYGNEIYASDMKGNGGD